MSTLHPFAPTDQAGSTPVLALLAAGCSGIFVAVQARINAELGTELGSALVAALVSFTTGLLAVLVVVVLRPAARAAVPLVRSVPRWALLGGLGGASLVAVGAAAAPQLGVALLSVGLVAGQISGGLVVDRVGLGPGAPQELSPPRLLAAGLCLVAVVLGAVGGAMAPFHPVLVAAVVVAGFLIAGQQALNGRVRMATGHAAVATLVNFAVGTAALGSLVAVLAFLGVLGPLTWPGEWWLYLGGPLGAAFVAVAAVVVRRLGVLRLGLAVIAGQLTGGVLLDLLLPVADQALRALTLVAVALTFLAVGITGIRRGHPA
ncbi:MAG TPA: DMT family transporter [Mycobacteriales bacterium]|nr:DMT family transporter [Mycobacteriales bacterium]